MDTVIKIAVFSLAVSIFAGWVLNSLIFALLKIMGIKRFNSFPSVKKQILYAFLTGIVLFIIGVILFITNVEMH